VKPRPVLVEWADHAHWSPGTWVDLDILDDGEAETCGVISVGWLLQVTDDAVVICQSITEADDGTGLFVIARATIKRLEFLRP
jgi:hypothetical protein